MLSINPWASAVGAATLKSRVVIALDQQSYQNNTANQTKIQDMVDQSIMKLTGITDKVTAYESLFPGLTISSKIVIKYNDAKSTPTRQPVITALTNSLKLMKSGAFPAANITAVGKDSGAAGTPSFNIGSTTYTIRNTWTNCNYFINMPPCFAIAEPGVAMSLKNMITAFTGGSISSMHSYYTNATTPALSLLNSQQIFKQKQVLTLMDAICISPGGTATVPGYSIIASKDMVAVDYQGILMLKATNQFPAARETSALRTCELAAAAPYNIGTNLPANMEVLRISPPYTTEIISSGSPLSSIPKVDVKTSGSKTIFNYNYGQRRNAACAVYDMGGRQVWAGKETGTSIVWEHNDLNAQKVPSGAYVYMLKVDDVVARGTLMVKR
jgi:hypothetical protein